MRAFLLPKLYLSISIPDTTAAAAARRATRRVLVRTLPSLSGRRVRPSRLARPPESTLRRGRSLQMEVLVLGAGQDVGRSCIVVTLGDKRIMFDCGMHMGYKDNRRFPDFSKLVPDGGSLTG